jgi:excisionase family DNA binding protein
MAETQPRWLPAQDAARHVGMDIKEVKMALINSYRNGMDEKATANYLGVPASAIARLISSGKLPAPVMFGNQKRWSTEEIDRLMSADIIYIPAPKNRGRRVPSPRSLLGREEIVAAAIPAQQCRSGIYFLIMAGEIVYVGQSVNILSRIAAHVQEKTFDSWHWVSCPPQSLDYWERKYLDELMPPLNADRATVQLREAQRSKARDA